MANQLENIEDKKPMGLAAKAFVAASGLVLGAGTMVLAVNHMIYKNLRKAMQPGFDRLDRLAKTAADAAVDAEPEHIIGRARNNAQFRFSNAILARHDSDPLRAEFSSTSKSIFKDAFTGADKNVGYRDDMIMHQGQASYQAVTNMGNNAETAQQAMLENIHRITIESEMQRYDRIFKDLPGHIPLFKRLGLSKELHLTGNQKLGAGLAFVGGAAVAAGALYYSLKHYNESKDKVIEAQSTGMY